MAELSEMPFGFSTQVDPRNYVLGGGLDLPQGRGNFGGHLQSFVKYREYPACS